MAHVNPSIRIAPRAMFTPALLKRSSDAPPSSATTASSTSFKTVLAAPTTASAATPAATLPPVSTSPAGGIGTMSPWPPLNVSPTPTPSSVPMAPTAQSLFGDAPWITNAGGSGAGVTYKYNPIYFATPQTAAKVAQMLGGTVVAENALTPSGPFAQNQPNQMVQLPSGKLVNAGLIADMYNHGYTQQMVDKMLASELSDLQT